MYSLIEIASKDVMIMGLTIGILVIIFLIILISKKRNKVKPIDEFDRYESEPVFEINKDESLTKEQIEAKQELKKVFDRMNEDLQKQKESETEVFEKEQEENAVISYTELMEKMKNNNYLNKAREIEEEPINAFQKIEKEDNIQNNPEIEETNLNTFNIEKNKQAKKVTKKEVFSEDKKFKSTEFISPIYGRQKTSDYYPKNEDVELNGYDIIEEKKDIKEEEPSSEFLESLKQFRNNL